MPYNVKSVFCKKKPNEKQWECKTYPKDPRFKESFQSEWGNAISLKSFKKVERIFVSKYVARPILEMGIGSGGGDSYRFYFPDDKLAQCATRDLPNTDGIQLECSVRE